LLVDASKFGQVKSAFFATVDQFDSIITSQPMPEAVRQIADAGGRLIVADASR
jgi:DeoR family transcriptional regulator, deoxyribose operon repressor